MVILLRASRFRRDEVTGNERGGFWMVDFGFLIAKRSFQRILNRGLSQRLQQGGSGEKCEVGRKKNFRFWVDIPSLFCCRCT